MPVIASAAAGPTRRAPVLRCLLGDREGDTDEALPPMMLTPAPMSSLTARNRLVGVARVVFVLDGDRRAVDLACAVGRVVEAGLEAVEVLLAVACERPGLARDDADRDLCRA
jgi:hypothetical protein